MLEGLDEVPWDAIHHAYGTAEDVPDLLRRLVAPQESAEEAVGELFGNIWHQGSLYEATSYAVPFLIEIFESPSPVGKDVGYLLRRIADGTSYHAVHHHRDRPEVERIAQDAHEAEERTWVGNAHAAVNSGLETYLRILADRTLDDHDRVVATSVSGGCRERRSRAFAGLLDVASTEPPGDVRAGIVRAVDDLLDADHPPTRAVVDLLRAAASHDASHPLTQGLAIVALLRAGDHLAVADVDLAGPLAVASVEMVRLPWEERDAHDLFDRPARPPRPTCGCERQRP